MSVTVELAEIGFNPYAFVHVPIDALPLAVMPGANGRVFLIVQGDKNEATKQITVQRLATSQPVPPKSIYIDSVFDGTYFWHYYVTP